MTKAQRGRRKAPVPIRSFRELLDRLPEDALLQPPALRRCHERWRLLWEGTLWLLREQEPRAFARVLAKLQRHGLVGPAPTFERGNGGLTARERVTSASGLFDLDPSDAVLARAQAYADDRRHMSTRGRRFLRRLSPRLLLVMAYYGARWKLTQEPPPPGPRLQGDKALEERAVARVAERYGGTAASVQALIKRARAGLHPTMRQWIESLDGELLWALTMPPEVKVPRIQGKPKT